jgi:transposase-like protein
MHQVFDQILEAFTVLEVLGEGFFDATAIFALPGKYRRRVRTTNMLERFIDEIRRRKNQT